VPTIAVCPDSSVILLLLAACPPTVARFIIPVVIREPVECLTFWAAAHIGKERGEAVTPTLADLDSATSIIAKIRVPRIMTPPTHIEPANMFAAF
jgi:hypothetical protein